MTSGRPGAAPAVRAPSCGPRIRPRIAGAAAAVLIGAVVVAALAVVVLRPQLTLPLLVAFRMTGSEVVTSGLAVAALAVPLAMTDARSGKQGAGRVVLTRRNLILSLTVLVAVAAWYGGLGHSFLPIAVFVIVLPLVVGVGRLMAARRGGLEYGLLRGRHHRVPSGRRSAARGWRCFKASWASPTV